jgi:hypothetical protein
LIFTQIHLSISINVKTSQISGTFFKLTFQGISNAAAIIGKLAFFDHQTFTVHDNLFHHFTISIGYGG